MFDLTKRILNDNIKFLIDDLQGDIIDNCINILTDSNLKEISKQATEDEKVRVFLDIISTKSLKELDIFINHLKPYYFWLYERLRESRTSIKYDDILKTQLHLGGVPSLPHNHVTRKKLLQEIRERLKILQSGQYLVLFGMVGCGKTTLASEALHDLDLIYEFFNGRVYWLTTGSGGAEDLGSLQAELNMKLSLPEPHLSTSSELALIQLTKRFVYEIGSSSLIILDDVTSEKVLDFLKVPAKFLVITKNKEIIRDRHAHFIQIDEGFSKDETLEIFAKRLKLKPYDLPLQAEELYTYTKGYPLTVSLIAARLEEFKEDLPSRWKYYEALFKNKATRRRSFGEGEALYNAIGDVICNGLTSKQKDNFEHFAIFIEDINIWPEVLGTLWSMDKMKAEEEMMVFVRKSLAVRKWNARLHSYVYGVHDQILYYLKDKLANKLQELHKNVLNRYKESCNGDWSKLPSTDNYIYFFIGYHLEKAGMINLFPELYFDLEFIEAKLKITGPADVIRDFKKFYDYITKNKAEELVKKADKLITLVEYYGSLMTKEADIVQAILQESQNGLLLEECFKLAKKRARKYIRFPYDSPEENFVLQTFNIKSNEITAISFSGSNIMHVIAASGNGELKMYNMKYKRVITNFRGHKSKINHLRICSGEKLFLSASMDNSVMIWNLDPQSGNKTPSPRDVQPDYLEFFLKESVGGGERPVVILEHEEPVLSAAFSPDSRLVATLGLTKVTLWDFSSSKITLLWKMKIGQGTKCIDMHLDRTEGLLIVVGGDQGRSVIDINTKFMSLIDKEPIINLFSISDYHGGGLVLVGAKKIGVEREISMAPISWEDQSSSDIKLASVSSYIAIGREDNTVNVYHLQNGALVSSIPCVERRLTGLHVNDAAVLAAYSDGTLLVYPLEGSTKPLSRFKTSGDHRVLVRLVSNRVLEVRDDHNVVLWKVEREAMLADISSDCKTLAIISPDREVILFENKGLLSRVILSTKKIPSRIFILKNSASLFVALAFDTSPVQIWRKEDDSIVTLGRETVGCDFIELVQFGLRTLLLIINRKNVASLQFWEINGEQVGGKLPALPTMDILTYTMAGAFIALSYKTHLCLLYLERDAYVIYKIWKNIKGGALMRFSPSLRYLAVLHCGFLSLLDLKAENMGKIQYHRRDVDFEEKYLAVSNNGTVCIGGNGLVILISEDGTRTAPAFIDAVEAESNPENDSEFCLVDLSGHVSVITIDTRFI